MNDGLVLEGGYSAEGAPVVRLSLGKESTTHTPDSLRELALQCLQVAESAETLPVIHHLLQEKAGMSASEASRFVKDVQGGGIDHDGAQGFADGK